MSNALVVYYTRTGSCEKIAQDVAVMLNADIEMIVSEIDYSGVSGYLKAVFFAWIGMDEKITYLYNPAKYNIVVIVSPIWNNDVPPSIRTYISENLGNMKNYGILINTYKGSGVKALKNFKKIMPESFAEKIIYTGNIGYEMYYKNLEDFSDRMRIYEERDYINE